jgi:hypothetical protein
VRNHQWFIIISSQNLCGTANGLLLKVQAKMCTCHHQTQGFSNRSGSDTSILSCTRRIIGAIKGIWTNVSLLFNDIDPWLGVSALGASSLVVWGAIMGQEESGLLLQRRRKETKRDVGYHTIVEWRWWETQNHLGYRLVKAVYVVFILIFVNIIEKALFCHIVAVAKCAIFLTFPLAWHHVSFDVLRKEQ